MEIMEASGSRKRFKADTESGSCGSFTANTLITRPNNNDRLFEPWSSTATAASAPAAAVANTTDFPTLHPLIPNNRLHVYANLGRLTRTVYRTFDVQIPSQDSGNLPIGG